MKLHFQAAKNRKINYDFTGFSAIKLGWWYNITLDKWEFNPAFNYKNTYSSHQPCRSVKAFRRKLKKAPLGVKFALSSIFLNNDVYGYGSKK